MQPGTETIEVVAEGDSIEDGHEGRRVVTVDNKDNGETIKLRVPLTETIEAIIAAIYAEFRLTREPDDRLTCRAGGEDVFQFAALTLERYLHEGHCPELRWSFVGGTGGA